MIDSKTSTAGKTKIFVSYRRADSAGEVGRIVYHLNKRFGKPAVFNDVFDIDGGDRFRDVISNNLAQTKVMLVVIGNQWVDAVDDAGDRRLDNTDDYVRFEIVSGLSCPDCTVIPVLVKGQPVPRKVELPEALQTLVDHNVVHVRPDPDFHEDMNKLCEVIAEHVPPKKKWPKVVAIAVTALAMIFLAYYLGPSRDRPDTLVQIYDEATKERIFRPFSLKVANENQRESSDAQYVFENAEPSDLTIQDVDCKGFQFDPDHPLVEAANSDNDHLLRIFLDRTTGYLESITPNLNTVVGLPTDPHINTEISDESEDAVDVMLLVDNLTSKHIDVLFYWYPPSTAPELSNPLVARWTHLEGEPIAPGERGKFEDFGLEPGYFIFFASSHGATAVRLGNEALYKSRFAHVKITELNPSGFSVEFKNQEPGPAN